MKFSRITVDPQQMGGAPCVRGLRIPVATVVGMMADGMTRQEIQNIPSRWISDCDGTIYALHTLVASTRTSSKAISHLTGELPFTTAARWLIMIGQEAIDGNRGDC